jgi:hypothetical protein
VIFFGTTSSTGTQTIAGWITIGLAIALGIFGIQELSVARPHPPRTAPMVLAIFLIALVGLVFVGLMHAIADARNQGVDATLGVGFVLVGLGSIATLIGAIRVSRAR